MPEKNELVLIDWSGQLLGTKETQIALALSKTNVNHSYGSISGHKNC